MSYLTKHVNPGLKPQSVPLDERQVQNDAGGYVYQVDKWAALRRFLILGSEGGTYYVNERKLTDRNLKALDTCLSEDGPLVVAEAVKISHGGRAPKNDQAILVLAKASCHSDVETRRAAWSALPKICRIGTHLYMFAEFRKHFGGGWGHLARESIGKWYLDRDSDSLARQVAKYKNRGGWSARDLLRLSHPTTGDPEKNSILRWVLNDQGKRAEPYKYEVLPEFLLACDKIKIADKKEALVLIRAHSLPREVVPTELLTEPDIWEALLSDMPMTAMIRNLGKMSSIGLLVDGSIHARTVAQKLGNEDALKKARIHPINMLMAMKTYGSGHGVRGKLKWNSVKAVLDAMDDAFYLCFQNVEPIGKPTLMALDVSGSMGGHWGTGGGILTPREISAAMAMVTMRTEKEWCTVMGFSHEFIDLKIGRTDSLETVIRKISGIPFGATDCALPMIWAQEMKANVDAFFVYTDSETWSGQKHPSQALKEYRQTQGQDARFICCATEASKYTISDPADSNSLDIAGFDSATPAIMSSFARGDI